MIVLGGGNTAMDCCRTSRRLGGEDVKVIVRSGFEEMKASPWEKEDAIHEDIPILNFLVPEGLHARQRQADRRDVREGEGRIRRQGPPQAGARPASPTSTIECDDVLVAVGQENAFPWIERDFGIEFDKWDMPRSTTVTFQSTHPEVFFGGDAAFGPKNIIWAVAHGHEAAISIDKFCHGEDVNERPPPGVKLVSAEDGHPRVELRQRRLATTCASRCRMRDKAIALQEHQDRGRTRLRRRAPRFKEARALPELRRADGVRATALHRVRRLRRHLPGGLHHLHRRTATRRSCARG